MTATATAPYEYTPHSLTMRDALSLLHLAVDSLPVCLPGLGELVNFLSQVDRWAHMSCVSLGFKFSKHGNKEEEEEEERKRKEQQRQQRRKKKRAGGEGEVGLLMEQLGRAYGGSEELGGWVGGWEGGKFRWLELLEEGLADMVEMVMAREESQEKRRREEKEEKEREEERAKEGAAVVVVESQEYDETSQERQRGGDQKEGDQSSTSTTTRSIISTTTAPSTSAGRRSIRPSTKPSSTQHTKRSKNGSNSNKDRDGVIAAARDYARASSSSSSSSSGDDSLRCFCQLPENESKMRTLVNCDGCHEWFHPHCANFAVSQWASIPSPSLPTLLPFPPPLRSRIYMFERRPRLYYLSA